MHLIKISSYVAAVVVLVGALSSGYQINAWASDIEDIRLDILQMEKRAVTTSLFRESTRESKTSVDRKYQEAMVKQLTQDLAHVNKKIEKIDR